MPSAEFLAAADDDTYAGVHRVIAAVVELGGAVGWLAVPGPDETRRFLDEQLGLAGRGDGAVCVVRHEGVIEAFGVWNRFQAPVVRQNAEVRKVMVHPDARGLGLGKVVTQALTDHASEAGIEVLMLDARGNNHAAHALYEELGFVRCGQIPDFIAVGAQRWDRVFFARRLTTPEGTVLHGGNALGPGASVRSR